MLFLQTGMKAKGQPPSQALHPVGAEQRPCSPHPTPFIRSPVSLSLPGGGLPLILGEWPSQPWRAGLPFFLCFPPRDMEPNVLWDQTVQPSPLSPSLQAATVLWQPTVPGAFL